MKVSHIEHLGIAVKSLDEAIPYWENVLGLYNTNRIGPHERTWVRNDLGHQHPITHIS